MLVYHILSDCMCQSAFGLDPFVAWEKLTKLFPHLPQFHTGCTDQRWNMNILSSTGRSKWPPKMQLFFAPGIRMAAGHAFHIVLYFHSGYKTQHCNRWTLEDFALLFCMQCSLTVWWVLLWVQSLWSLAEMGELRSSCRNQAKWAFSYILAVPIKIITVCFGIRQHCMYSFQENKYSQLCKPRSSLACSWP